MTRLGQTEPPRVISPVPNIWWRVIAGEARQRVALDATLTAHG
ncbi:hypothetical protein [Streptomyces sp. TLI_185]|nr:hypothetical protein [Streptomyces sp. TLI_185]RPF39113.1 hypothetical protein EDD92_9306 [Streptomyces sp. TLI_185]